MRALWSERRARLAGAGEAQTEEEWIRPVLREVLGWSFDVQTGVTGLEARANRPDYALFAGEEARDAAAAVRGDERRYYARVAAVADAKGWDRSLDARGPAAGDPSNRNPSFQIVAYLVSTGVDWGMLTNGREWRLYSGRARSRIDTYYGVDLGRILDAGDAEAFRWFWLFFRAAAFRPDPRTGAAFLDAVLRGSAEYGAELETALKRRVFDDVFERLASGFVDGRRRRGVVDEDDASLREVYQGTLRLLYRILFVLHAEARELLPVRDAGYGRYSLARLRRTVAGLVDSGQRLSSVSTDLWNDLAGLFAILDQGDPELQVPRYNGGLFRADDERNRFLRENAIADSFLVHALDHLSRDGDRLVDYKSLSVEQLGSLYEGLLEYRLVPGERGRPVLVNEKGERKATGSYYTPQWVVEHIVSTTVGPAFEERAAAFRTAMGELAELRQRMEGAGHDARVRLERQAEALGEDAAEELLSLRVCDPAMGSGHFLVHAADWLTERMIALLAEFPDNPVLARLTTVRDEIVDGLAEQGIRVDPALLRDTSLLKRMVMKRCIYGVDLNPMATELAKLSLWLDSFTVGAPLSFLDHHLKHGNSLVGARVADVQRAVEESPQGQFDAFGGPFRGLLRATEMMRAVAFRTDATFDEVAASARTFEEFEAEMRPYRRLLDVWVSRAFGNHRAEELASLNGEDVLAAARGERVRFAEAHREAFAKAEALEREHRFFHWELEFPEVFIDLERAAWKDDPGFDAVIGNPPCVRQEQVRGIKPYLAGAYADVYDGAADLYVYFYRQGIELLRPRGRMSHIGPGRWLRAGYGEGLRGFLTGRGRVERIVDFGHAPIVPDADVFRCIVVVRRPDANEAPAADGHPPRIALVPREELGSKPLDELVEERAYAVPASRFGAGPWTLERDDVARLLEKIRQAGVPLREYVGASPLYGIRTGLNEAYLIDGATRERLIQEDPNAAEVIRPYLRGQDIERWSPAWAGLWMIVLQSSDNHAWSWSAADGEDAERRFAATYPSIHAHMKPHEPRLRARQDRGRHWWELRRWEDDTAFDQPKIVYPDVAWSSGFALDTAGWMGNNTVSFVPAPGHWLLAVLNSPLMWYVCGRSTSDRGGEALRLSRELVAGLPVAPPPQGSQSGAETAVERLVELTSERRMLEEETAGWLRAEFGLAVPGQKMEGFADLSADDFIEAVRGRLPKKAPPLAPLQVSTLRKAHGEYAPRLRTLAAKTAGLERKLAQLVNRAYGLSPEDVELMWSTAPPRMPVGR